MELRDNAEEAAFRAEVRDWLADHLVGEFAAHPGVGGVSDDSHWELRLEWEKQLAEARLLNITWPREYGGRGRKLAEEIIFHQEHAAAAAPYWVGVHGRDLFGPTLLHFGTDEQKTRFLPAITGVREFWGQGFSEPEAGSDLAGLKTRAERDGDEWVINGQKIWTTQAKHADYIFLLARTDPEAPKHAGISYLLVPMKQEGVEVRPITQPDGSSEFNEVFLENARCPKENVVGGLNNGWKVAMTTLGFERGSSATTSHRRFEKELEHIIDLARANGALQDPVTRQRLMRQWSKIQIMRVNGLRTLSATLSGAKDAGVAALGATNKMFWSETHRDTMNLAMDILGADAQILTGNTGDEEEMVPGYGGRRGVAAYPASVLQSSFFFSRSETIWGGTAEIQRNIVGERVLGLPKEPKP